MMRLQHLGRKGFTALELIVVVIIIGLLASAGMSKYKDFTSMARRGSCLSNQEQITSAIRLQENDSGALATSTVLKLHADGTLDFARPATPAQAASTFAVRIGTVPPAWGVTNTGTNAVIAAKAQDSRIFRCPEDVKNLTPTYTGISDLLTGKTASTDTCPYAFAKALNSTTYPRVAFTSAVPISNNDPLEGYNWLRTSVEWSNSSFTFCRRYGLRDGRNYTGTAPASAIPPLSVTNDNKYYPGLQEVRLAHSQYAPNENR
jgi:prepilin-type N-terminal cleavage/methylation domain-containing protein